MKRYIKLLALVVILVSIFSVNVFAQSDWEFVGGPGGFSITNVTLDQWNDKVDRVNAVFNAEGDPALITSSNVSEMDKIEKVPMLFLGVESELSEKWTGTLRYEYIFGAVEGNANVTYAVGEGVTNTSEHFGELDVEMHGLAFLGDYALNDNWSLRGGLGIYDGTKIKKLEGAIFTVKGYADDSEYDLDATSYRLGVGYENSFAESWSFNGTIDYLYMEVKDEDPGEVDPNIYSKGLSYSAGVTYKF